MNTEMEPHLRRWCAEEEAHAKKVLGKIGYPTPHGLLTIFTGNGKGKSTAAFVMAWRAIAHQMKVGVVQFIGGCEQNAELRTLGQHPQCDFRIFGTGCKWNNQHYMSDKVEMVSAWLAVSNMMDDPAFGLIICDEINPVIHHRYLNLDTIRKQLAQRRPDLHMVFTGRSAPFELLDLADLVTEMQEIRHPFSKKNLGPQAGVDY